MKCKHCENKKAKYPACNNCGSILEIKDRVNEIVFSYSGLSSFESCRHAWYLTYVEEKERSGNFWADFGLLVHETLEKFFLGEMEAFELSQYYLDNWDRVVINTPPYFVKTKEYKEQGLKFFERFTFNKSDYHILVIEGKSDAIHDGVNLVVKPDLIIQHKETGKKYLLDYKSSLIWKNGKMDNKKWDGYKKQMSMYSAFSGHDIDEVWVWFIRDEEKEFEKFKPAKKDLNNIRKWISKTVEEIKSEEEFKPTIEPFFCEHLCSVNFACKFYSKQENKKTKWKMLTI